MREKQDTDIIKKKEEHERFEEINIALSVKNNGLGEPPIIPTLDIIKY